MKTTVNRAFKFRLYPTEVQVAELSEWIRQLRRLYNLGQEQRMAALSRPTGERPGDSSTRRGHELRDRAALAASAWMSALGRRKLVEARAELRRARTWLRESKEQFAAGRRDRVTYYRQGKEMTELLSADDQLARVVCSARQEVLRDLDKAWQRWRKKLGGRPRFKRRTDRVRIYFSTTKHWKVERKHLVLAGVASSVGPIEINQDRLWPEDAKFSACHITRDVDQWFAVFPLEYSVTSTPPKGGAIGLNRGAVHAIADSYGRVVDAPHHYVRALEKIAKLSRELARKEPGSRNRHKAVVKLAQAHRTIRRQREFFLHNESSYYTKKYGLIGIEDWSTKAMTSSEPDPKIEAPKNLLNRKILDVGWYEMARQIDYKAEATGARVVHVLPGPDEKDPAGISTMDSITNLPMATSASGDMFAENGFPADVNAARNVLLRTLRAPKTPVEKTTVSIKIKGRSKKASGASP